MIIFDFPAFILALLICYLFFRKYPRIINIGFVISFFCFSQFFLPPLLPSLSQTETLNQLYLLSALIFFCRGAFFAAILAIIFPIKKTNTSSSSDSQSKNRVSGSIIISLVFAFLNTLVLGVPFLLFFFPSLYLVDALSLHEPGPEAIMYGIFAVGIHTVLFCVVEVVRTYRFPSQRSVYRERLLSLLITVVLENIFVFIFLGFFSR